MCWTIVTFIICNVIDKNIEERLDRIVVFIMLLFFLQAYNFKK